MLFLNKISQILFVLSYLLFKLKSLIKYFNNYWINFNRSINIINWNQESNQSSSNQTVASIDSMTQALIYSEISGIFIIEFKFYD